MKGKLELFILVLCLGINSCFGEKNSLQVTSPDSLRNVYECSTLNFVPQKLVGTVVYPNVNKKACKGFDKFSMNFKSKRGELPIILLVDRGDCYFRLKEWNAQNAGAAAILVADYILEPLIPIDIPEDHLGNITIPAAFITKTFGNIIKKAILSRETVNINLDWRESLPHPEKRIEYEFWTSTDDGCGPKCNSRVDFIKNFRGAAQMLEQNGYTKFTPHYITWYCPHAFIFSKQCKSQCINHGRYCAPDPEQDFSRGYEGKDVVVESLRQACLFKVASECGRPWVWWDYVTNFATGCQMKEQKYTKECADQVIQSLGLDIKKIDQCIGDLNADVENPVLKAEEEAQKDKGSRGDVVATLNTLVINKQQYTGKLEKGGVLKAICAGFEETTKPAICLSEGQQSV